MSNKYKRNYLTNVIFRLDFENVELKDLKKYSEEIKEVFTFDRTREALEGTINVNLTNGEFKKDESRSQLWIFKKGDEATIEIGRNHFIIDYRKYKDTDELIGDLTVIAPPFLKRFDLKTIHRVGLRYVNQIKLEEKDQLNWSSYISSDLVANFNFVKTKKYSLARLMSQMIIKLEDSDLTMSYGIWNPDYPNQIVRKEFVIDIDCSSKFPISASEFDLLETAKKYNDHIDQVFEDSITDGLRALMNAE